MTWDEVCAIARELPEVDAGSYHGYPALRVRGKFLTRLGDDGESLELKGLDPMERDLLLETHAGVVFLPSGFAGRGVFLRLKTLRAELLRELLERRWRGIAPASLSKIATAEPRRAK